MKVFLIPFILGILVALTAAVLLWFGIISSGIAAVVGIVGIGLMASSASVGQLRRKKS